MSNTVQNPHPETDNTRFIPDGALTVTEEARRKIIDLVGEADDDIRAVRVYVYGGGCSGMNYGMTFAEVESHRDSVLEGTSGFKLVIDPVALGYMRGAEIDFNDDGVNASFVFNNVFQAIGGSGSCSGCGGAMS